MFDVRIDSNNNRFRAKRIDDLNLVIGKYISKNKFCNIIDIGGTDRFWNTWKEKMPWEKINITCINLKGGSVEKSELSRRISYISGDARCMPHIEDRQYDIAFSNSVIEHVGTWHDMYNMANEIRRISGSYYLQTPYFWFPVEPHARTPFIHWLPESLSYRLVMARKTGFWGRQSSVDAAVRRVQSAKMLDLRQFRELFPDAEIRLERFFGLVKSMVAIRSEL